MRSPVKKLLLIFAIGLLIGTAITRVEFGSIKAYAEDRYSELQVFAKVLNLVQQYYVEEVDAKKLLYGGIKGMLRELDPHTNFLPPDVFKEFESETSGEFGGLGIEISVQNSILTIIAPIEDAPAWEAGIQAGDKIVAINTTSTKGLSLVEAAQLMRGKLGTPITLSIIRGSADAPKDYVIKRGNVKVKSVKYVDFEDGYAYVRITSFIENTFKDLEKTLADHTKKYGDTKGILLDLRRNPGGLLDQAVKVSDLFLDDGIIVSTIGRDKNEKEVIKAKKDGGYPTTPLVVLINDFSASASEIVSGALQDNHRALITGTRSFGKGSVQSVVKLGDGSGLKLTVARYYTPSGRSIQSEGITPDIEIENLDPAIIEKAVIKSDIFREKDMDNHLLGEKESKEKLKRKLKSKEKDAGVAGAASPGDSTAWWNDIAKKPEDKLSPRDKMLKSDYQAFQAFNYLKAWKIIRKVQ